MPKALTEPEVNQVIKSNGNQFELIPNTFKGTTKRVGVHCSKCKIDFNPTFNTCRRGKLVCPECDRISRLNEALRNLSKIDNRDYQLVNPSKFKNVNEIMEVKHLKCGKTFMVRLDSMFKKTPKNRNRSARCPYCGATHKVDKAEFLSKLKNTTWELIGEYSDYSKGSSYFRCKKCGYTTKISPREAIRKNACSHCNRSLTEKEVKEKLYANWGDRIELISRYTLTKNKGTFIDHRCGHKFTTDVGKLIRSIPTGCPYCSSSHMENTLIRFLDKNKIDYTYQVKFKDLKDKQSLSYDFYLPDWNVLIELDGEQHFEPFKCFGGEKRLGIQKKHDFIKRGYAISNGYNLICISYSLQRNLIQYLKRSLNKVSKNTNLLLQLGKEYNV